jgi:glycosyltransferase involved in cell wall biosynthesis
MNIAIFTNNYLPNPFGVSMSIESFRKEFERLGHTVYVFAPAFKGFIDENQNVFRYGAIDLKFKGVRFPIVIPYSYHIDRILEKLEIDVIHCQHPNLLGWQARRWAKKKKVPLVFTWHTLYDQYTHFVPFFIPKKFSIWWTIKNAVNYANKADQVIIPTESIKKIIQEWGVKNENIIAIPTGVNSQQLDDYDGIGIRNKFEIKNDEILLVLLTRLTQEKNIEFLFRAVIEVLRNNAKVKFLACGDGDLLEVMKNIVKKNNVEDQVIFAGFVPNDVKKNYYAAGDIFVFASKSETQGMIISEAMYCGLPVVAIDATGVRDMVKNDETGFLVGEDVDEFFSAVLKLAEDADLRKKFSENAMKVAKEEYTSEICGAKMLKVYADVIERKPNISM